MFVSSTRIDSETNCKTTTSGGGGGGGALVSFTRAEMKEKNRRGRAAGKGGNIPFANNVITPRRRRRPSGEGLPAVSPRRRGKGSFLCTLYTYYVLCTYKRFRFLFLLLLLFLSLHLRCLSHGPTPSRSVPSRRRRGFRVSRRI